MLLKLSQLILLFDVVFNTLFFINYFLYKKKKPLWNHVFFITIFIFSQISMRTESKRTWVNTNNHYTNVIKSELPLLIDFLF